MTISIRTIDCYHTSDCYIEGQIRLLATKLELLAREIESVAELVKERSERTPGGKDGQQ